MCRARFRLIAAAVAVCTTASRVSLAQGSAPAPAHHWVFEKGRVSGSALKAVRGPDGRILGQAYFAPGKGLGALILDGETNSVMISEQSSTAELPKRDITVEAWVAIARDMKWGGIVGAVRDNGKDESGWVLGFRQMRFFFAIATTDKPRLTYLCARTDFTLDTWYHVVGTYDGREHRLYVNGRPAASDRSRKADILYPPTDTFYEIGAYHDSNEYFRITGMIHEVAVYRRALKGEVVAARYHAKKDKLPAMARKPEPYRPALGPYAWHDSPDAATVCWETEHETPSILAQVPQYDT